MLFFGKPRAIRRPLIDDVSAGVAHAAFNPKVIVEETFAEVRYIGPFTTTSHPAVPDIPTIAESGLATAPPSEE
jgi:hypothetical protein